MNILLLGGGGREHALAWRLAASPVSRALYCAPGNAGMAAVGTCVALDSQEAVARFCAEKEIPFVVVGPEGPLAGGIVDFLEARGLCVFGPRAAAARLESSKAFTRRLCAACDLPGAAFEIFEEPHAAVDFLKTCSYPRVVKADGLAAGKGVVVAQTPEVALEALSRLRGRVVIEECLQGREASFFALCDGTHAIPFGSAQDYKRIGDGDTGPNTGGMGAFSPALTPSEEREVMERIVRPTLRYMDSQGTPFRGVLYAGLMMTPMGPHLIEFNVRFGDPECQLLMRRVKSDPLPLLYGVARGRLQEAAVEWDSRAGVCVVMAARGYPGAYDTGGEITIQNSLPSGVEVFHAATRSEGERLIADGGRVLNVTALGLTVGAARRRAYEGVACIEWSAGVYRRDIAEGV